MLPSMPQHRTISVIGAGRCDERTAELAREVGRRLAEAGCTLVTGGLGGVMEAASRGAREADGLVIGILPGARRDDANPFVDVPVVTGMGEARNAIVAATGQAVIAIAGEFGTLSEIAFALKRGKPIVSVGSWQVDPKVVQVESAEEAVEAVLQRVGEGT